MHPSVHQPTIGTTATLQEHMCESSLPLADEAIGMRSAWEEPENEAGTKEKHPSGRPAESRSASGYMPQALPKILLEPARDSIGCEGISISSNCIANNSDDNKNSNSSSGSGGGAAGAACLTNCEEETAFAPPTDVPPTAEGADALGSAAAWHTLGGADCGDGDDNDSEDGDGNDKDGGAGAGAVRPMGRSQSAALAAIAAVDADAPYDASSVTRKYRPMQVRHAGADAANADAGQYEGLSRARVA